MMQLLCDTWRRYIIICTSCWWLAELLTWTLMRSLRFTALYTHTFSLFNCNLSLIKAISRSSLFFSVSCLVGLTSQPSVVQLKRDVNGRCPHAVHLFIPPMFFGAQWCFKVRRSLYHDQAWCWGVRSEWSNISCIKGTVPGSFTN